MFTYRAIVALYGGVVMRFIYDTDHNVAHRTSTETQQPLNVDVGWRRS